MIDCSFTVQEAIEQVRPRIDGRNHRLILELSQGQLPVYGDSERLTQVVANLLSNAAKYTDPGDMYKLSPERIDASLAASMAHNNSAGDGSIHVVLLKDVPQELRGQLIPIN